MLLDPVMLECAMGLVSVLIVAAGLLSSSHALIVKVVGNRVDDSEP